MPSHLTPFDDDPDDTSSEGHLPSERGRSDAPNYLLRRAIVVAGGVAIVIIIAVIVARMITSLGNGDRTGAASTDWNRIVTVDPRSGRLLLYDTDGEQTARIDPELSAVAASAVVGPTALITSDREVAVVDLDAATFATFDIAGSVATTPTGSTNTMIAAVNGTARGVLVHGPSGDVIDTADVGDIAGAKYEFATAHTDTSGRHVLVTDTGNFQSVLFSFDRDEPSYFPGLALAVSDEFVVTTQNVGNSATVSVFDHDGALVSSGQMPSVRAAIIGDNTVRLITVNADVMSMRTNSNDVDRGGALDIGTVLVGTVVPTGDRIVVSGTAGTAIVADDGKVVATIADHTPPLDSDALRGATCIDLTANDVPEQIVLVELGNGTVHDDIGGVGEVIQRAADGCTVARSRVDGFDLVGIDRDPIAIDDDALVELAPNASRVAVERERRLVLTDPADPTADAADLGARGRAVWFTKW